MADASPASRDRLVASQEAQLRRLIAALHPGNAFYSQKLKNAEIHSGVSDLSDYFKRFPFTFKHELVADQKANPPYGTNLTFPIDHYVRCHQTSGTTGVPLRWPDTVESWNWLVGNWKKVYQAAGISSSDRIFFAFSFGPFIGFWLAFDAAVQVGCLCLPGGGLSSTARVKAILDQRATAVCCTPTYAIHLAQVAAEEKLDLGKSNVRTILVAGEPGGSIPATREQIQKLWHGARVFDHHGMTEVGPVSYECPARPGVLHIIESSYLTEIIDPVSGSHVETGCTGELVLTTLGRIGSPLLRYRTGDLVRALSQGVCGCGEIDLALEGGILGRVDDMVVVRGVNIYPSAIEEVIRGFGEIAEYQVEISRSRALVEMEIVIEPSPEIGDPAGLVARLERAFLDNFALRVPVRAAASGTLPRFELKAKRWVIVG